MTPDLHALISQMATELDHCQQLLMDDRRQRHPLADHARALLAEPEAEGPRGRPAAAPVPVSERLPGPEDCDAEGRCWRYIDPEESLCDPMWELARSKYAVATYGSVAWLPASALPLPAPEKTK